ncbi:hypothetical protein QTP88_015673 [Uroleucon formosanum]
MNSKNLEKLSLGTWNVHTLYATGALMTVVSAIETYRLDIVAIQELRWTGSIRLNNHTKFYSGGINHEAGVGFIIKNVILPYVKNFIAYNDRLCYIQVVWKKESGKKKRKTIEEEYLNSRTFFGIANELTKKRKPRDMIMKDSNNVLITEEKKIAEEFREAFKQLLRKTVDTTEESITYLTAKPEDKIPSKEKIEVPIKMLKNNKAPEEDLIILSELLKNGGQKLIPLHLIFIDFKQAYDSVQRTEIWRSLKLLGVPSKLISMIRVSTEGSKCAVKFGHEKSEEFQTTGLKQGDALSPILFNIVLEMAVREAHVYLAKKTDKESVAQWSARLRDLASKCGFGTELEVVMRDVFVVGMGPGRVQDRLLEEDASSQAVTLVKLVEIATNKEATINASKQWTAG